jgi:hypothetical protein
MSDTSNPNKKQKTDETTTTEPTLAMAMTAPTGSIADTSGRTSETPVSLPPTITYGLQDTHTTILPAVFWMSAPSLTYGTPTTIGIRMNSIYDIIETGTIRTTITANQFWTKKCGTGSHTGTTGYNWPSEFGDNNFTVNCWYRDTWDKLYENWTVLGCEYEITLHMPAIEGERALVAQTIETLGSGTNNTSLPTDVSLFDIMGMKNIRYHPVENNNNTSNPFTIIKGTYKPGTAKRDVSNDGDVKLWSTGTTSPSYKESLRLYFYRHPFSVGKETNDATDNQCNVNIQVRLKYIVQYKQLKQSVRYPTTGATNTNGIIFPGSAHPVA